MLALGFVGFLLVTLYFYIKGLGVLRAIIWVLLILTIGRGGDFLIKELGWLFPNLFEDCGFIESFIPLWA